MYYKFKIEIFKHTILFFYQVSDEVFLRHTKKYIDKDVLLCLPQPVIGQNVNSHAITMSHANVSIIRFFDEFNVSTLAHEAFHVTEAIMDNINTPLNEHTSEPWAYTLGFITKSINDFILTKKNLAM